MLPSNIMMLCTYKGGCFGVGKSWLRSNYILTLYCTAFSSIILRTRCTHWVAHIYFCHSSVEGCHASLTSSHLPQAAPQRASPQGVRPPQLHARLNGVEWMTDGGLNKAGGPPREQMLDRFLFFWRLYLVVIFGRGNNGGIVFMLFVLGAQDFIVCLG